MYCSKRKPLKYKVIGSDSTKEKLRLNSSGSGDQILSFFLVLNVGWGHHIFALYNLLKWKEKIEKVTNDKVIIGFETILFFFDDMQSSVN